MSRYDLGYQEDPPAWVTCPYCGETSHAELGPAVVVNNDYNKTSQMHVDCFMKFKDEVIKDINERDNDE